MLYTAGIDVGSSAVKTVVMAFNGDATGETLLAVDLAKIRKRDPKEVIRASYERALASAGRAERDIAYVATTGEGEMVDFRRGHFYSMTSHARGTRFLNPAARGFVDLGALHQKAVVIDERSKVLLNRMTSQCAAGSGQFLENISRYLGVGLEDVGRLSLSADKPELVSGICAVLAETDVINMVSRGISPANILKGIHLSMAKRLVGLLRIIKASGTVFATGGLAADTGLVGAMRELLAAEKGKLQLETHEHSVYAGAIGTAIWGAFRHVKLGA
jgi:benzoyl-CoA reductase subunit D